VLSSLKETSMMKIGSLRRHTTFARKDFGAGEKKRD
jgi:hypothetical protein